LSWAKNHQDTEFKEFTAENAKGGGVLVFGRITYVMMKSYWPAAEANKNDPTVAERMNSLRKVVFSKTLDKVSWNNTKLVKGDLGTEIRKLKKESEEDIVIMGSGSIVSQLTQQGLIDEYQLVLNPVILGKGRTMFEGVEKLSLNRTTTRTFGNGNVLLCYQPIG